MLTNYGGHLLSPTRVIVIAAANDSLRDSLFAFAQALPASQWWPAVAIPYGVSPTVTAFAVTGPTIAAGTQMTLADIDAYVNAAAGVSAGFTADGHTVFVVFLPPGVTCSGSNFCAASTGAFHVPFGPLNALAVIYRSQAAILTAMTYDASHEIIESATDPEGDGWRLKSAFPPWEASAWGLNGGVGAWEENADMCAGAQYLEGGFYYQRVFSNQAAALGGDPCVPAIPAPYFNVVTTNGWYSTTTGEVSIPITGWSIGTVSDWVIAASPGTQSSSLPLPTFSYSCADTVMANGKRYCGMNNGKTATLRVVLPPGAPSSSYFTFQIFSYRIDANGQLVAGPGEDGYHLWTFGVYIP